MKKGKSRSVIKKNVSHKRDMIRDAIANVYQEITSAEISCVKMLPSPNAMNLHFNRIRDRLSFVKELAES